LVLPHAASTRETPAARAATPMIRDLLRFLTVLAGISRLLVEVFEQTPHTYQTTRAREHPLAAKIPAVCA
jgi:hypothetical protein